MWELAALTMQVVKAGVMKIHGCPFASKRKQSEMNSHREEHRFYLAILRPSVLEPYFHFGFGQLGLSSDLLAKVHIRIQVVGERHFEMLQLTRSEMGAKTAWPFCIFLRRFRLTFGFGDGSRCRLMRILIGEIRIGINT